MYLFDKKDGIIDVYELVGDPKKLKEFRHNEIAQQENTTYSVRKIIQNQPFLGIRTSKAAQKKTYKINSFDGFDGEFDKVKEISLNQLESSGNFRLSNGAKGLLDNYCNGEYVSKPAIKVIRYFNNVIKDEKSKVEHKNKEIQLAEYETKFEAEVAFYLIITEDYKLIEKISTNFVEHYIMDNIISVTKPLYILQLFEQSRFAELPNDDVDKLLDLFKLNQKPIQTFSTEYMGNLVKYNLMQYNSEFDKLMDSHQKILKKLR